MKIPWYFNDEKKFEDIDKERLLYITNELETYFKSIDKFAKEHKIIKFPKKLREFAIQYILNQPNNLIDIDKSLKERDI